MFLKGGRLENLMQGRSQGRVQHKQCPFSSSTPWGLQGELLKQPHGNDADICTHCIFERRSWQCAVSCAEGECFSGTSLSSPWGKKSACSYMVLANTESLAGGEIPAKAKQPNINTCELTEMSPEDLTHLLCVPAGPNEAGVVSPCLPGGG